MAVEDYKATMQEIVERHIRLNERRAELEAELDDLQNELSHLDQIIGHLTPLAGYSQEPGEITGLGITDAIRSVLMENRERMSAADVFQRLKDKKFNFSKHTYPMASIYKILTRLKEADEVDVETEGRKIFYKWKFPTVSSLLDQVRS